jgi:ADP-heptose:LPS heptosyltransferase
MTQPPGFTDPPRDAPPSGALVPGVGKLAVLRANALGDLIVTLPALEALRAAYPTAELVLLGSGWHPGFLTGRPGPIDRCLAIPPTTGIRDDVAPAPPEQLEAFFAAMHRERFDLAVQLQGGGRHSNPFLRRLGAHMTAGSQAADAPALDRNVCYTLYQPEVLRFLEVVRLVGASPVTLEPRLQVTTADRAEASRVLPHHSRPLVVLHPGATDPRRRWPISRLATVGAELARKGARLAVVGTAADAPLTAHLVDLLEGDAADLTGRLSLGGLAGLLERATLLVGNDSGPRHLAAAVGTATVAVYWAPNLLNVGPLTRNRHRTPTSWRIDCPACGTDALGGGCGHDASLVTDVDPDRVLAEALDVLTNELAG